MTVFTWIPHTDLPCDKCLEHHSYFVVNSELSLVWLCLKCYGELNPDKLAFMQAKIIRMILRNEIGGKPINE